MNWSARRIDPALGFAPRPQVQGLAAYGQAASAALLVLVSAYLIIGMLRDRGRVPKP
ncbi:MAG: hypothetical protein HIU89_07255 [Proteobacteria bacterium]|nr:hypothetical protein [Pseudomonadota bacterium]